MKKEQRFLGRSWANLTWSSWVPFSSQSFKEIPNEPGLYRVKPINQNFLSYIGQTGKSLRIRLSTLRKQTLSDSMPYNDPHTAAPCHWAWGKTNNMEFECSGAVFAMPERMRIGLECYLLWQYRLEHGESPIASLGRFHPNYSRPTNRKQGRLGSLLPKNKRNESRLKSVPPLLLKGEPFDNNWMNLNWVNAVENKFAGQGLYKILDLESDQVLYIGQSKNIGNRLDSHLRKDWGVKNFSILISELPQSTLDHQRLELENDLLGAFYSMHKDLPQMNSKKL